MRRVVLGVLVVVCAVRDVQAQRLGASPIFGKRGEVGAQLAAGNEVDTFILLPTVPIQFSKLEKDASGKYRMGGAITLGVGATWMLGKATYAEKDIANLNPYILFGTALNTGLKEKLDGDVSGATLVSIFAGFSAVSLSYSWDLLDGAKFLGLSTKSDVWTNFRPKAYLCHWHCPK
jgi:hypothetical protein